MSKRYQESSRFSDAKYRQVVKCFALDLTITQTADLCSISRNAVNRVYVKIRELILKQTRSESPFSGEIEADESYFGPRRVKGKRGRGAGIKTIVFGLLKRDGKVYTEIVPNAKAATLQSIIRGHASIESVIHTDDWAGYDGLVDVGFEKHFRVNHGENEFSTGDGNHINGIESFWGFAKHRLVKFKGIPKEKFEIYLLETEFRFNMRGQDLYKFLLKMLRNSH
jgi:transposase-like protein